MPSPPILLTVEGFDDEREIVPRREQGYSGPIDELAIGFTKRRLFLRAPSGKLYVVQVPDELADELHVPSLDEDIAALFHWRDGLTDRYGDDLAGLLISEFGTDENGRVQRGERDERVPVEHRAALAKFRAYPSFKQWQLANFYAHLP